MKGLATRTIYYFSGTGNFLALARDIAHATKADLVPIASVVDREKIEVESDSIGLVFPVYFVFNGGIPMIVERFVDKPAAAVRPGAIAAKLATPVSPGARGRRSAAR
jgi:flavodoxin